MSQSGSKASLPLRGDKKIRATSTKRAGPCYLLEFISKFQTSTPNFFIWESSLEVWRDNGNSLFLILNFNILIPQLENRDLEKKLQDAKSKIEELHKEKDALQTRLNAVGIKKRLTPSKRGRNSLSFFSWNKIKHLKCMILLLYFCSIRFNG